MSKLYDKYLELKNLDDTKLYLFKSGIFYIGLNDDAKKLSEFFDFKITNLNDTVIKCGFPEKRLEFYSSLLEKLDVNFEVVDLRYDKKIDNFQEYLNVQNSKHIIDKLINIDFNNITFKEAFEILNQLSEEAKRLVNTDNEVSKS
jgi:hypothetical protein